MKAPLHQNHLYPSPRKLLTYPLCTLLLLALLYYHYHHYLLFPFLISAPRSSPPPVSPLHSLPQEFLQPLCDYSAGAWVPDPHGPLYNGTSCDMIKPNQNCMAHGRPDTAYLYWRWRPSQSQCVLPRFDPSAFLDLIRNRHLAFIGDSLARNQAESLMCLLASGSTSHPDLVYRDGVENRHRRWIFRSHNVTVSIYWSPFLVKRIERSDRIRHNRVFLDAFDETWMGDLDSMDVIMFSLGHWFLIPGIYYDKGQVIRCHVCAELNHTETGFFDLFRKVVGRTLEEVRRRHAEGEGGGPRKRLVTVMTFPQSHFEGEWDKAGSCARTQPYKEGEVQMEYTTREMRASLLQELDAISKASSSNAPGLQFAALDVTRLTMLRPDGHPGPYMYPHPFWNARPGGRVHNDCVHWCMPGPVDTFNELLWQRIAQSALFS